MSIQAVGLQAYATALKNFNKAEAGIKARTAAESQEVAPSFSSTLNKSLETVNDLQAQKKQMITSFASGETQNVHELMISLQKAGLAMNMTAAVRNKVIEAYRELTRLQF